MCHNVKSNEKYSIQIYHNNNILKIQLSPMLIIQPLTESYPMWLSYALVVVAILLLILNSLLWLPEADQLIRESIPKKRMRIRKIKISAWKHSMNTNEELVRWYWVVHRNYEQWYNEMSLLIGNKRWDN